MRGRLRCALVATSVTTVLAAGGCSSPGPGSFSSQDDGNDGDCIVKVRYDDQVYRAAMGRSIPQPQQPLGEAEFGDCDGSPLLDSGYTGRLFALAGVDPRRALLLRNRTGDSVYVNTTLSRTQWPTLVKRANKPAVCRHPVTFTGAWDFSTALTDEGAWNATVPYTVHFTATKGEGMDFDTWSSIGLTARITKHTKNIPSPRFMEQAAMDSRPVTVRAVCDGHHFEVSRIRFAD